MEYNSINHLEEKAALLAKKKLGLLTAEEEERLGKLMVGDARYEDIQALLQDEEFLKEEFSAMDEVDARKAYQEMHQRIVSDHASRSAVIRTYLYRVAAVVLMLVVGGAFWYHRQYTKVTPPVISERVELAMQHSNASGMQGAEIVSKATSNQPVITKEEYALYHVDDDFAEQLVEAKRISTYHNKEYWVTLDDGSLVHLNYNSRLIYPERFGDRRDVILDGEAYFMVAKDQSRQFVVHTPQGDVKVYGTEFVVNTREEGSDEHEKDAEGTANQHVSVVLVSGSVGFTSVSGSETMLQPSQKLLFCNDQLSVKDVDVAPYVAWNEGEFIFADVPLEDLLATMSRWYQLEVRFENKEARHMLFTGTIDRYGSAEVILHSISKVTGLVIEKKGNHVIIK
ncbi:MAG: DUF4974 domain-containing protein [Prevotella sp.]|nr:DUF4974 domain-containing protein [Prevotella sp.]MBQ9223358.1 DUF4974 domain-containing protein [Prevotella sp.]